MLCLTVPGLALLLLLPSHQPVLIRMAGTQRPEQAAALLLLSSNSDDCV